MILLDTHTLIWFMYDDSKIPESTLKRIKTEDKVYVSIVSLWEISIKQSLGKINISNSISEIVEKCKESNINILQIDPRHLDYIKKLPYIHGDPFDRLIISEAITEGMTLITKDSIIPKYEVIVLWE